MTQHLKIKLKRNRAVWRGLGLPTGMTRVDYPKIGQAGFSVRLQKHGVQYHQWFSDLAHGSAIVAYATALAFHGRVLRRIARKTRS